MHNQPVKICAINGWVPESRSRAITVSIEPSATDVPQQTGLALICQGANAYLAGDDLRNAESRVKGISCHM